MKFKMITKVALSLVALAATNVFAATPGAYVGGQLGWGKTYEQYIRGKTSNTGLAGRVYGGYQFSENWSAELGWDKFTNVKAKTFGASHTRNAVDLVGKYTMPIANNFGVYGKLGGAYVWENSKPKSEGSDKKLMPTFGLGGTYDFTPNLVTDLSWTRIQHVGSSNIGSSDLVSLGLSYYFG